METFLSIAVTLSMTLNVAQNIWGRSNLMRAIDAEREAKQTEKNAVRLIAKMIRAPHR